MKRVYLETTIISYLAALPSRDLVKAARQEISWEWWLKRRVDYELYISAPVIEEISKGDDIAAKRRIELVQNIPMLAITEEIDLLILYLMEKGPFPPKALGDAAHIAVAAAHGMDFLLTWNCKHLANAELVEDVTHLLQEKGYHAPFICTPDELLEPVNDV